MTAFVMFIKELFLGSRSSCGVVGFYYFLLVIDFEYSLHVVYSDFAYKYASCVTALQPVRDENIPTHSLDLHLHLRLLRTWCCLREFALPHIKDESLGVQFENNNLNGVSQTIWPITSLNLY
jgi:hypothetical protein